jgi:hypothetical protein
MWPMCDIGINISKEFETKLIKDFHAVPHVYLEE